MRLHNCVQGTQEWLRIRAGIPTASAFDQILTAGGNKSKSSEKYRYRLLAERMMGHPITEYISFWMKRGSEMEEEALAYYEFQRDIETIEAGFVTDDAGTRGASPDRFVGNSGLMEIKCPSESEHVSYLMQSGSHYENYKVQVQGQLLVCEREWTDVLSYHPELPWSIARIGRDEAFIKKLDDALDEFTDKLEEDFAVLVSRGWASESWASALADGSSTVKGAPSAHESFMDAVRESLIATNQPVES